MAHKRKMDKVLSEKLDQFHQAAADAAEEILFVTFPNKILQLQQLIKSTDSPTSPFHPFHIENITDATVYPPPGLGTEEPELKKRKRSTELTVNGTSGVPTTASNDMQNARYPSLMLANRHNVEVHEIVKKECEQLAQLCDKVKLWVNLSMPKIEDGDNFGVQIQEEVLTELHRSHESALNIRDSARQNYLNRAKICSKIIKYPHVEDYSLALKEHDEKQLYIARQNLFDIRNIYAILTDIMHKNLTKISQPKGNNSFGLY